MKILHDLQFVYSCNAKSMITWDKIFREYLTQQTMTDYFDTFSIMQETDADGENLLKNLPLISWRLKKKIVFP